MSLSIRWRLGIWIVIAFAVVLAGVLLTVRFSLERILANDLDGRLSRDANRLVAQITLAGSLEDEARLQQIAQQNSLTGAGQTPFVTVIRNTDGDVVAATPGLDVEGLELSAAELESTLSGRTFSRRVDLPGGQEFQVRTTSLSIGGVIVGVIQVGEGTEAVSHSLNRLQLILFGEAITGLVLALSIAYLLSGRALKPLERVVAVAAEIEASDLGRRIAAKGQPEEVQKLADTFDAMLARLQRAFEEQRNFVLDVSHDLRTPLAALRGNIDVLLMSDSLDAETRAQLEHMSAETGRLIRLTANLLYMASADAGREPERRPVELDVVCLEVYQQVKDLRLDVGVRLGNEDQLTVMGDRDLLKQMVLNLAENAVKYSPRQGSVTMSLYRDDGKARIVIEDTGPGISDDQLPHIFERFYRGNSRGKTGGSGLGLAIASWVAQAHGGNIDVDSEPGRGSTFSVILPLGGGSEPGDTG